MITVHIIRETLTDGSYAFDVRLPEMRVAAITEKDAYTLAETIAEAYRRHTNETIAVDDALTTL